MIYDPDVETRPVEEQYELDRAQYEKQVAYLFENSTFYQRKLAEAGFHSPADVGGLDDIAKLPFTEKDEIRATQASAPPFGAHLAADPAQPAPRFQHQSGTTGVPCYLGPHGERPRHVRDQRGAWLHGRGLLARGRRSWSASTPAPSSPARSTTVSTRSAAA
jgi:hypothetical protein